MFPNISYNPTNGNDSLTNLHMSNYQTNMSYINQQLQLNNSLFGNANTTLQLLQQHKTIQPLQAKKTRDTSSSSSSSSCSSTSSTFLPSLQNLKEEGTNVNASTGRSSLLPPIFNNFNQTASQASSILDSFKGLNPATLSMANNYLNNYLLSFTTNNQQSQLFQANMYIDKVKNQRSIDEK